MYYWGTPQIEWNSNQNQHPFLKWLLEPVPTLSSPLYMSNALQCWRTSLPLNMSQSFPHLYEDLCSRVMEMNHILNAAYLKAKCVHHEKRDETKNSSVGPGCKIRWSRSQQRNWWSLLIWFILTRQNQWKQVMVSCQVAHELICSRN